MSKQGRVQTKNLFPHLRPQGFYDEEVMEDMMKKMDSMKDAGAEFMKSAAMEDDGTAIATGLREMMEQMFNSLPVEPWFERMVEACNHEVINAPSTAYNSHEVKIYVHRPKRMGDGALPAVVYAHGGGAIAGTASYCKHLYSTFAEKAGVVIFSVEYRLAPEAKCPEGILDFYSAFKYVLENAEALKVDPARVAIAGESGGGYLTAGLSVMLADKEESHLVKLAVILIPMLDDLCFSDPLSMTKEERHQAPIQQKIWNALATDLKAQREVGDPLLFPGKASDETLAKFPPTVIYEDEFDIYITEASRFAARLRAAGRLLEFALLPGVGHGGAMLEHKLKKFHEYLDMITKIFKEYLVE